MKTENTRCFLIFAPRQLYSLRAQIELVRKDQTSFLHDTIVCNICIPKARLGTTTIGKIEFQQVVCFAGVCWRGTVRSCVRPAAAGLEAWTGAKHKHALLFFGGAIFEPLKRHHFTKTGSGQTDRKLYKVTRRVTCGQAAWFNSAAASSSQSQQQNEEEEEEERAQGQRALVATDAIGMVRFDLSFLVIFIYSFILVVSAAVVFCLCPEPVLAAASRLSRACLGNRTQNTVSFCFRFVLFSFCFRDPQGLNLNIKRVIFTTLEKYLLSRRTFVYKPMDLNRDWSPCSLRRGIKTAGFERKRPEL